MSETSLKRLLDRAEQDEAIPAVFLFGSVAGVEKKASSDFDVAIVLRDPIPDRLVHLQETPRPARRSAGRQR